MNYQITANSTATQCYKRIVQIAAKRNIPAETLWNSVQQVHSDGVPLPSATVLIAAKSRLLKINAHE